MLDSNLVWVRYRHQKIQWQRWGRWSVEKRKLRKCIELGAGHPLTQHSCKGSVRTKFCTSIFGENTVTICPKDDFDVLGETEEEKLKAY